MRTKFSMLIGLIGLLSLAFNLQAQELPAPSPAASVTQKVGLTNVSINYSSPAVKGRTIFGELEPFGKAWRAGANAPTKITFSSDVTIGGKEVKAGTYIIFVTPQAEGTDWTFHFNGANKNIFAYVTESGQDYAAIEADDVVSVKVQAQAAPMRERLTYLIEAVSNKEGKVTLWWDKTMVSFHFEAPTDVLASASVETALKELEAAWYKYYTIANYYTPTDATKALEFTEKAMTANPKHFAPAYKKALLLADKGDFDGAASHVILALSLGDDSAWFKVYKPQIEAKKADLLTKVSKAWKKNNKALL